MSMLHTVNKSPYEKNSLERCLAMAKPGSAVLLLEDGVYGAMRAGKFAQQVQGALERVKVYALEPDLKARGMDSAKVIDGVTLVDYGGFVDLAAEHDRVQAWL